MKNENVILSGLIIAGFIIAMLINGPELGKPEIFLTFIIISQIYSAIASIKMDISLHKRTPEAKPYKWGYYIGWMGILGWLLISVYALSLHGEDTLLEFLLSVVGIVSHIQVLRRNRHGWIVAIILQLNPISWIINGIYLKNRWSEMEGIPKIIFFRNLIDRFNMASYANRALIAGSIFWGLVVIAFVLTFSPFGNYVSSTDLWKLTKIIVFPPAVAITGYMLFVKVVKKEDKASG